VQALQSLLLVGVFGVVASQSTTDAPEDRASLLSSLTPYLALLFFVAVGSPTAAYVVVRLFQERRARFDALIDDPLAYRLAEALNLIFRDASDKDSFDLWVPHLQKSLLAMGIATDTEAAAQQVVNIIIPTMKKIPHRFHYKRAFCGHRIASAGLDARQLASLIVPNKEALRAVFPACRNVSSLAIDQFMVRDQSSHWPLEPFSHYIRHFFSSIEEGKIGLLHDALKDQPVWAVRAGLVYAERYSSSLRSLQDKRLSVQKAMLDARYFSAEAPPTAAHGFAYIALDLLEQTSAVAYQMLCICVQAGCGLDSPQLPMLLKQLQRSAYRLSPIKTDYRLEDVMSRLQWLGLCSTHYAPHVLVPEAATVLHKLLPTSYQVEKRVLPFVSILKPPVKKRPLDVAQKVGSDLETSAPNYPNFNL
jgi:hypothetical protein